MELNKDEFFQLLNSKDYVSCIGMLRKEIINDLTKKIQKENPSYKYSMLSDLKTACFKYLDYDEQHVACMLYDFDNMEKSPEDEISQLLEMYKILVDINA